MYNPGSPLWSITFGAPPGLGQPATFNLDASTTVQNLVGPASEIITNGLKDIAPMLGAMIGLGIIIGFVYKHIGGNPLTYQMESEHDMRNKTWKGGGPEF